MAGRYRRGFGTSDRHLAHRVLRTWLHCLRDRLSVEVAAHFDAQPPELLRGVFFGGWNPSRVPQKYDRAAYVTRFAREARIRDSDAVKAARIVSAVARRRMSAGVVAEAFGLLPADLRDLLEPAASEAASAGTSCAGHRSPAGQHDQGRAQCRAGLVPAADHGRLPVVTLIDDLRQGLQPGCGAEVVAGIAARIKELDEILGWDVTRLSDPGQASLIQHRDSTLRDSAFLPRTSV